MSKQTSEYINPKRSAVSRLILVISSSKPDTSDCLSRSQPSQPSQLFHSIHTIIGSSFQHIVLLHRFFDNLNMQSTIAVAFLGLMGSATLA